MTLRGSYGEQQSDPTGDAPFGYDVEEQPAKDGLVVKVLVPNREEQSIIAQMIAWRQEGRSLRHITHLLMRRGVKTKTGKSTRGTGVVGRLLKREMVDQGLLSA